MKWSFKIYLFCALLLFIKSRAQLDTLNYLKQFEANKASYIGQPLFKLLNDMTQIQPKTVWSLPLINNKTLARITSFKFCEMDYSFYNAITMKITWNMDIPFSQTNTLGAQIKIISLIMKKLFIVTK